MAPSLNIGLVAYHAVGNLAFVKIPSERGRYMLTDLCVIAVECPQCGAMVGEPCRSGSWANGHPSPRWNRGTGTQGHGCSVHIARKIAADQKYGRGWKRTILSHYKLRLDAGDLAAAMTDAPAPEPPPEGVKADFDVTRKP